jgi:hypothetical protein
VQSGGESPLKGHEPSGDGSLREKEALSALHWLREVLDPERSVVFLNTDSVPALESRAGDEAAGGGVLSNQIEAELVCQITGNFPLHWRWRGLPCVVLMMMMMTIHARRALVVRPGSCRPGHHLALPRSSQAHPQPHGQGRPSPLSLLFTVFGSLLIIQRARLFGGQINDVTGDATEIHTVDKYQGRDKDCIIVSLVRSNAEKKVLSPLFLFLLRLAAWWS